MRYRWVILLLGLAHTWASEIEEQKIFFNKYGYLVVRNFYSKEQVRLLREYSEEIHKESKQLLELAERLDTTPQALAYQMPRSLIVVPEVENQKQICRSEDMLSCYPGLCSLIERTLLPFIANLMGESYIPFKDKLNFKWPGGGAFLPHQDFPAYDFFGPKVHITAMVAIDEATVENGCLQVAQDWKSTFMENPEVESDKLRQGKAILPYVKGGKAHGSIEKRFSDQIQWIPLESQPGDVILITSFVPHYSEPNASSTPRRAMLFTLNRGAEGEHRATYYQKKREDSDNPAFHFATPTRGRSKGT